MDTTQLRVRPPAVAGAFYPRQPARLQAEVKQMLTQATRARLPAVRALVVPHAGYRYSGPIAANGFCQLESFASPGPPTVYLLGPAHYVPVPSIALAPFDCFETPLGLAPQNRTIVEELAAERHTYQLSIRAHEPEHCLEVELPFLQTVLAAGFELVAMLCGSPAIDQVAADLAARLRPADLVVVSSDLSHFYTYEEAQALDREFLAAVLAGDSARAASGEACGLQPILILMRLAQLKGWQPTLLDYRNSGDTGGDRWRVVGYAAIAYTDRTDAAQKN